MAKRTWEQGWPELIRTHPYARAISTVIEEEKVAARALVYEEEAGAAGRAAQLREDQRRAKQDAQDQRTREARATRAALNTGMGLLGLAGELSKSMLPVVRKTAEALEVPGVVMAPGEVLNLMRRLAWIGQASVGVIGRAMELERLRLGKPEKILGMTGVVEEFDADRAVELLGSEAEVKNAMRDLIDGNMSERAAMLIEACVMPEAKDPLPQ